MKRLVALAAVCAICVAVLVATWTARLNSLGLLDAGLLVVSLWLLFAGPLACLQLATVALCRARGRAVRLAHIAGVSWAGLLGLLWFGRLEPTHQWLSVRPHISRVGLLELTLLAAGLAVVMALATSRRPPHVRVVGTALASLLLSGVLLTTARWVEPSGDRDPSLRRVTQSVPQRPRASNAPSRVLVLGIDGLDWRSVDALARQGRVPTLASLIVEGRSYRIDNRSMWLSAPLWAAMYTGYPQHDNGVGGFDEWQFAGLSRPVFFLPTFGAHPIFMLDVMLDAIGLFGAWHAVPTTTQRLLKPPIWTIASASGLRVGVFDPVPFVVISERVSGFFGAPALDGYRVTGPGVARLEQEPSESSNADRDRARAAIAARAFQDQRLDLGVYYTHFIDSTAHFNWDYGFKDGGFGGDPEAELDERFTKSAVADAYDQVDIEVRSLIEAFGEPATVIVVSDHGWDYSDYEHFLGPEGVLIISGTGATGYGGTADVLALAPTVLSLLGLPAGAGMYAPLADVTIARGTTHRYDPLRQDFILQDIIDPDRRELLRSLGYLQGR